MANEESGEPAGQLEMLLQRAAQSGASDLHLSAGLAPAMRLDGEMQSFEAPPLRHEQLLGWLGGIMNDRQRREYEAEREADFSFQLAGVGRFRVNAFRQNRGAAAVFRAIPAAVLSMAQLGMGGVFEEIARLPRGLALVTGPTGSGKSTTLAALIDFINEQRRGHILTIEDPIEFVHQSKGCVVNQREVHRDSLSFHRALRSALREDPDVILVGELRDLETVRLAMTAAETGHLVFATLHTASAGKTVDRIVDLFPGQEKSMARSMLSESLQAVVAQTLIARTGGGRVAAQEILIASPAVRNLIREDKTAQIYSAIQTGGTLGMQTLDQSLRKLLNAGLISHGAARACARSPRDF